MVTAMGPRLGCAAGVSARAYPVVDWVVMHTVQSICVWVAVLVPGWRFQVRTPRRPSTCAGSTHCGLECACRCLLLRTLTCSPLPFSLPCPSSFLTFSGSPRRWLRRLPCPGPPWCCSCPAARRPPGPAGCVGSVLRPMEPVLWPASSRAGPIPAPWSGAGGAEHGRGTCGAGAFGVLAHR